MAKDPGRTPATAKLITLSKAPRTFRDSVSSSDRIDYYSFRLNQRSSFQLTLNNLKANADVALFNGDRNLVQRSSRLGRRAESISNTLEAGTYYVQILRRSGRTAYRLILSADSENVPPPPPPPPGNAAPVLTTNAGITVPGGDAPVVIDNSVLAATDSDGPAPLLYTLTNSPLKGSLRLNGTALGNGSTFTQADINAGLVSYSSSADSTKVLTNVGSAPQISGSNAVWVAPGGSDQGTDNEVFFYDGVTGRTTQLTTDSFDESTPQISDSNVVWAAPDQTTGGTNTQIFLYEGTTRTTRQLTTNTVSYSSPSVSQNPATGKPEAIWLGFNGNNTDVYLFDGDSTVQLTGDGYEARDVSGGSISLITDPGRNDISPQINRSIAVWTSKDNDVFFVNTASSNSVSQKGGQLSKPVFQLSSSRTDRSLPVISPFAVVWANGGAISFFTGGAAPASIPTSGTENGFPQISASDIVFSGAEVTPGSDTDIFYFNNANFTTPRGRPLPPIQITTNGLEDFSPQISTTIAGIQSSSYIAWTSFDGVDNEVYYYDGSGLRSDSTNITPVRLTNNITDDTLLGISGSTLFWSGTDPTTGERELFYQDVASGSAPFQTRNDDIDDYAVLTSGSNVLWYDPSGRNSAIFSRTLNRSDSFSFTVADGAGATTGSNTFNIMGS